MVPAMVRVACQKTYVCVVVVLFVVALRNYDTKNVSNQETMVVKVLRLSSFEILLYFINGSSISLTSSWGIVDPKYVVQMLWDISVSSREASGAGREGFCPAVSFDCRVDPFLSELFLLQLWAMHLPFSQATGFISRKPVGPWFFSQLFASCSVCFNVHGAAIT